LRGVPLDWRLAAWMEGGLDALPDAQAVLSTPAAAPLRACLAGPAVAARLAGLAAEIGGAAGALADLAAEVGEASRA
jgi:hypothetical protein